MSEYDGCNNEFAEFNLWGIPAKLPGNVARIMVLLISMEIVRVALRERGYLAVGGPYSFH
jgi:hypothetical protein